MALNLLSIMSIIRAKPRPWKGESFSLAEVKENGHRITILREDGIRAFGRKTYIDLWPQLCRIDGLREKVERLPFGTVVDGEGFAVDGDSTDFITALNNRSAVFRAFAVPYYGTTPMMNRTIEDARFFISTHTEFDQPEQVDVSGMDRADMLRLIRDRRIEGLVLKTMHYGEWFKLKPLDTIDVIVTGIIPGKPSGKHEGRMGALSVSVLNTDGLVEIGRVGGWDDVERIIHPKDVIGRVLEVRCEGLASKGRLKFARRVRWRDDKPASECTIDQLESIG